MASVARTGAALARTGPKRGRCPQVAGLVAWPSTSPFADPTLEAVVKVFAGRKADCRGWGYGVA